MTIPRHELAVQLLESMGYGGEVNDTGEVTRTTNDGSIGGVIKDDGLGRVHLQAKGYARKNTVGREPGPVSFCPTRGLGRTESEL